LRTERLRAAHRTSLSIHVGPCCCCNCRTSCHPCRKGAPRRGSVLAYAPYCSGTAAKCCTSRWPIVDAFFI
jgi:hypothetical protein